MVPGQAAHQLLVEHAPLVALVGARVYPVQAVQGSAFPRVVYSVPSTQPASTFERSAIDAESLNVDIHARNRAEAHEVGKEVRRALQREALLLRVVLDEFEPGRRVYRLIFAFQFFTKTALPA
jgi:hypothetical protein